VAKPGQYFTATIAGNPVLVVRDADGILRAFYNVCRHRGGPLAMDAEGRCKALTCKYHGWTYRLDGSLRGVPRWNLVELFDKADYGLVPLRVDVWEGLVFVALEADAGALVDCTAGIRERIAPIQLGTKRFAREVIYEVACNWKVYVDNYLEGYHVPYVHPELMKLYDFQSYATETFTRYSLQWTRLAPGDSVYSTAEGDHAYYYFLFPNFMLNILPGRLQTNLVEPLGPDRCRVVFRYFYDDVESPDAERLIAADLDYSDRVQVEDIEICEAVQRGLGSRGYDRGRFSVECEQGVYHFQQLLKEHYRRHLGGAA
jgi:choline monooxygenase